MENQIQQIAESIKQANNVLVTVSNNPNVDQLSAAIGFALLLNKLNKHGAAVFSGAIPSTIQFLKPEKTIEKNTDSLRDFIIALDKSKADKLRYKVEDEHVKIFITPYRTSINQMDLQFSQGDFNVDVVLALGVHEQKDLDQAITAHGRILHDATVISVNNKPGPSLGSLDWTDEKASSLSEMIAILSEMVHEKPFDGQMATAFLTGIVAETERFSNEKTGANTMAVSGKLIAAGANQQLVAEQLEPKAPEPAPMPPSAPAALAGLTFPTEEELPPVGSSDPNEPPKAQDGALLIDHTPEPAEPVQEAEPDLGQIHIDETGELMPMEQNGPALLPDTEPVNQTDVEQPQQDEESSNMIMTPPSMGGQLSAVSAPDAPADDGMSLPPVGGGSYLAEGAAEQAQEQTTDSTDVFQAPEPLYEAPQAPQVPEPYAAPVPVAAPEPAQEAPEAPVLPPEPEPLAPPVDPQTITDLEQSVDSPHFQPPPTVIAPQPSDAPAERPMTLGLPPVQDTDTLPEHPSFGVQGHKRIEPIPHDEPHLSLPLDPILGDTSVAGAADNGMPLPPASPPPMMPGIAPLPALPQMPVSGQVFPPTQQ